MLIGRKYRYVVIDYAFDEWTLIVSFHTYSVSLVILVIVLIVILIIIFLISN